MDNKPRDDLDQHRMVIVSSTLVLVLHMYTVLGYPLTLELNALNGHAENLHTDDHQHHQHQQSINKTKKENNEC